MIVVGKMIYKQDYVIFNNNTGHITYLNKGVDILEITSKKQTPTKKD